MPLFSIVIPTRNRPDLVKNAVASAAWQDRPDIEIIVSDNSTDADSLKAGEALAAAYASDPRIRIVRPPSPMNMPDHWEFATRHATGEYLLILTDRFVMRPGTLDALERIVDSQNGRPELIVWNASAGYSDKTKLLYEARSTGKVVVQKSIDVLRSFAALKYWQNATIGLNDLPRGLNSAISKSLVDKIRAEFGRMYFPITPDYTSAFIQSYFAKNVTNVNAAFYIAHGDQSNGQDTLKKGVKHYTDRFDLDPFEGCPIKIDCVVNLMVRDYYFAERLAQGDFPKVSKSDYLILLYREILMKRDLRSSLDLKGMTKEILKAAEHLPESERAQFEAGKRVLDGQYTLFKRAKIISARLGVSAFLKRVVSRFKGRGDQPGGMYADVLEAARRSKLRSLVFELGA